jgi:biotin synthesis protein BioG
MKCLWIARNNCPCLFVFFNGWGMDRQIIRFLTHDSSYDILMLYDYRNLHVDKTCSDLLSRYQDINVIAWSMGVWAYAQTADRIVGSVRQAIALNGTLLPVHDTYGIPPSVYQTTIENFSASGRKKFFRRMCGSNEVLQQFYSYHPRRSLSDQREELIAIQKMIDGPPETPGSYTCALVGRRDRIFPTQHQINFWQDRRRYILIDAPHFPFFLWNNWKEILEYATED